MSDMLKPCPLCGESLIPFGHDLDRRVDPPVVIENFIHSYKDIDDPTKDCCLSRLVFDAKRWNKRPFEDKQDAEIKQIEVVLDSYADFYQKAAELTFGVPGPFLPSESNDTAILSAIHRKKE